MSKYTEPTPLEFLTYALQDEIGRYVGSVHMTDTIRERIKLHMYSAYQEGIKSTKTPSEPK